MSNKINVFIVDDDNLLIDGIAKFFLESSNFHFIDRANSPSECMRKLIRYHAQTDIILMDVNFPGIEEDGISLAKDIRQKYPGKMPRIVFMTISDRAVVDAEQGFHGLIPKNQGIQELMDMLKAIHYEEAVFPLPKKEPKSPFIQFERKERKIFCLLLEGHDSNYIANKMELSKSSVISNIRIIQQKVKSITNAEITNFKDLKPLAEKYQICK